jgi:hypothetical protein
MQVQIHRSKHSPIWSSHCWGQWTASSIPLIKAARSREPSQAIIVRIGRAQPRQDKTRCVTPLMAVPTTAPLPNNLMKPSSQNDPLLLCPLTLERRLSTSRIHNIRIFNPSIKTSNHPHPSNAPTQIGDTHHVRHRCALDGLPMKVCRRSTNSWVRRARSLTSSRVKLAIWQKTPLRNST